MSYDPWHISTATARYLFNHGEELEETLQMNAGGLILFVLLFLGAWKLWELIINLLVTLARKLK